MPTTRRSNRRGWFSIPTPRLIAFDKSNREMAAALSRSERTVERQIEHLCRKIGVHSKADATAYAIRHGLA